jgi:hypothetical protein
MFKIPIKFGFPSQSELSPKGEREAECSKDKIKLG